MSVRSLNIYLLTFVLAGSAALMGWHEVHHARQRTASAHACEHEVGSPHSEPVSPNQHQCLLAQFNLNLNLFFISPAGEYPSPARKNVNIQTHLHFSSLLKYVPYAPRAPPFV